MTDITPQDLIEAASQHFGKRGFTVTNGGAEIYIDDDSDPIDEQRSLTPDEDQIVRDLAQDIAVNREIEESRYAVSKLTIISRLEAQGKFQAAIDALKANEFMYEKWQAVSHLQSDDANAIALFTAIGCDPDEILARE